MSSASAFGIKLIAKNTVTTTPISVNASRLLLAAISFTLETFNLVIELSTSNKLTIKPKHCSLLLSKVTCVLRIRFSRGV